MWSVKTDIKNVSAFHDQEVCAVCKNSHDFTVEVEQEYMAVYGLRLFPLKKKYVTICLQCKRRKTISLNEKNGQPDPRYLKVERVEYSKFRYYTGWIMLAMLVALAAWLWIYMQAGHIK